MRDHLRAFKCIKSQGRRDSAQNPAGGAYSALPLARFRGDAPRERDGEKGRKGRWQREGGWVRKEEEETGKGEKGDLLHGFKGYRRPCASLIQLIALALCMAVYGPH